MQRLTHAPKRILCPAVLLAASVLVLAISMQTQQDAQAEAAIYKPSAHVGHSPHYTAPHAGTSVHVHTVTSRELFNLKAQKGLR